MKRLALIFALGCLAAFAVSAAAATRIHGLDRSYGTDGVVKISTPGSAGAYTFYDFEGFTAAADGDAFVFGRGENGSKESEMILRFDHAGRRHASYGGSGAVFLPSTPNGYTAFADRKARVVAGALLPGRVLLHRFTLEGGVDRSFGRRGVKSVPCDCRGDVKLRLFEIGDGKILVDLSREVDRGERYDVATRERLTELLPDGRIDRRFGRAGSFAFQIPRPGPLKVVAPTPGGAILFGGPGRPGHVPIYLWRVTPDGHVDQAFVRQARLSVRRMGALGHSPELGAIVPTAGGGAAALGSADESHGFYLRLNADGEPDRTLAGRGVERLPFTVQSALGGLRGGVFAVGRARNGYRYRAFRILRDGKLDPRYLGARGRAVPFSGAGIHVLSQGSGRVLVVGKGKTYCRNGCGLHPAMARFRE